jgi:hypothetical protein
MTQTKLKYGYGVIRNLTNHRLVCIKFSFSFNKTTARAATTSLKQKPSGYINCWRQWPMSGGRIDSG